MRSISFALFSVMGLLALGVQGQEAMATEALLGAKCASCHLPDTDGGLSRINEQRKTPEGWDMSIARMQVAHGVKLSGDERRVLVKYLSDTHGLAPSETLGQRAILERRPGYVESPPDPDLAVMCARCHTWGRVALQRRSESEWLKHVHFHVGQFPTLEYQANSRDRDWFSDAINDVVPALAKMFPYETADWSNWQQAAKASPAGDWVVFGHRPGKGSFGGRLKVTGKDDKYKLALQIGDGSPIAGQAIVYTGFEWRASTGKGEAASRQVMALSEDGQTMTGRWFDAANNSLGAQVRLVRTSSPAGVIGSVPSALPVGENTEVTFYGAGIDKLPLKGVTVSNLKINDDRTVATATVSVPANAPTQSISLGKDVALVIYKSIDRLQVEPTEAIARVGGNGGPIAAVPAQFDAIAFANGPDGQAGTDDDVRIGPVKAQWSVEPFDEIALHDKDTEFAGSIDPTSGMFAPAGAGPNPARKFGTNNAGNLNVVATVESGGKPITGKGHLIVTVQRFNDPPIH